MTLEELERVERFDELLDQLEAIVKSLQEQPSVCERFATELQAGDSETMKHLDVVIGHIARRVR